MLPFMHMLEPSSHGSTCHVDISFFCLLPPMSPQQVRYSAKPEAEAAKYLVAMSYAHAIVHTKKNIQCGKQWQYVEWIQQESSAQGAVTRAPASRVAILCGAQRKAMNAHRQSAMLPRRLVNASQPTPRQCLLPPPAILRGARQHAPQVVPP